MSEKWISPHAEREEYEWMIRFCSRGARALGLIELETLENTAIHPIWSEKRQDWVPLGELQPGETLRGFGGPATVLALSLLSADQTF